MTRVLAVSDADSYLKWSAATLDRLPATWDRRQLLVRSPVTPSDEQATAATGGAVTRVSVWGLWRLLRRDPPDVLLLACTGPTVAALTGLPALRSPHRPVLLTGLPGISVPASARAVELRRGCDLFIVHSRRELAEFSRLASELAPGLQVALSRLPFLGARGRAVARSAGSEVVFAAQAKVPSHQGDRESILLALAELEPAGPAVVKVRALAGEEQTHREQHPYPELWDALVDQGRATPGAVRFRAGSMSAALTRAKRLVTVSSTAALEAIDAGVPVLVLSDFGVSGELINEVFRSSGCLGTLHDLRTGAARTPDTQWRVDNYFHPATDDDLTSLLEQLLTRRAGEAEALPVPAVPSAGSRWRGTLRLVLPARLVGVLRDRRRRWRARGRIRP